MNDKTLKNSVAIVTGASKGIGRSIALALAKEGAKVILASRRAQALSQVQNEITASGGIATSVPTDITVEDSINQLIDETKKMYGSIDILINNAGVGFFSPVVNMKTKDYDAMMNVNLKGVFLCCRAVLPFMMKQRRGDIINIASLAGKNSFIGGSVYSATKWGLIGFGRSLMLETREYNIRVVTICPGTVNTSFADVERNEPLLIQPEDVASTALFALTMSHQVNVSEIDIRPTIKPK